MGMMILFDPYLPPMVVAVVAAVLLMITGYAALRGLRGWPYRAVAAMVALVALMRPIWQEETRAPLADIALVVVDQSASQGLTDRPAQTEATLAALVAELETKGVEVELRYVADADGNQGTQLLSALSGLAAELPQERIAGSFLLTDGQVHDLDAMLTGIGPVHALITGQADDWDRALQIETAPAYGILGEDVKIALRVSDFGPLPDGVDARQTEVIYSIDGNEPQRAIVPVGQPLELTLNLAHAGRNVVRFEVPVQAGELTPRNNVAYAQVNGVRDRLSVLLVSGEPHMGQRTWRNLLKSDPAVDLVHFTILRPPEKRDNVPVSELSLIAFPTRELFMDQIDDFDLIIFDRYQRRGILPLIYLENVARYVRDGGAVLVAAGPDFAGAGSLYRSPLADILPAEPTARVFEEPYVPHLSRLGARHPVTRGLEAAHLPIAGSDQPWGRWFRQVEVAPNAGDVVLEGVGDAPLLILDRVGEGRVALLASDHAWLWDRGYEGGGPQLELLRRLAHWMMKEPDLEEEALSAEADGREMRITRQTMGAGVASVIVTAPDGEDITVPLHETAEGMFEGSYLAPEDGLYRVSDPNAADLSDIVVGIGPANPREFSEVIATGDLLRPHLEATGGAVFFLRDALPDLRLVPEGRGAVGRGWMGLYARDAFVTQDVRARPLVPVWVYLIAGLAALAAAWLREGRFRGA